MKELILKSKKLFLQNKPTAALVILILAILPVSLGGFTNFEKQNQDEITQRDYYFVEKIIDGDTISVSIDGKTKNIRLIGVNSPETGKGYRETECFGKEALEYAKNILQNQRVFLESDSSQGDKDRYDRLLRYVFLENETSFNMQLISDGYAYEYTYNTPYKYQSEFKKAQKEAQQNRKGLWGDVCTKEEFESSNIFKILKEFLL